MSLCLACISSTRVYTIAFAKNKIPCKGENQASHRRDPARSRRRVESASPTVLRTSQPDSASRGGVPPLYSEPATTSFSCRRRAKKKKKRKTRPFRHPTALTMTEDKRLTAAQEPEKKTGFLGMLKAKTNWVTVTRREPCATSFQGRRWIRSRVLHGDS